MCYLYHKPLCIQLGKARENGKNHLVFFTGPVLPFDRVRLIPCWERLHSGAVRTCACPGCSSYYPSALQTREGEQEAYLKPTRTWINPLHCAVWQPYLAQRLSRAPRPAEDQSPDGNPEQQSEILAEGLRAFYAAQRSTRADSHHHLGRQVTDTEELKRCRACDKVTSVKKWPGLGSFLFAPPSSKSISLFNSFFFFSVKWPWPSPYRLSRHKVSMILPWHHVKFTFHKRQSCDMEKVLPLSQGRAHALCELTLLL